MSGSEAPLHLDVQLLGRAAAADVLSYLRDQQRRHPESAIAQSLLHLITIEAVSPDLSRIWLGIAREPATLRHALEQNHSLTLRYEAIRRFASVLRSKRWRPTWDALGSAQGLAQLLLQFSAKHVSLFAKAIANNVRGLDDHNKAQKREAVTQLLLCLVPSLDPSPSSPAYDTYTTDSRDLFNAYASLVPACTPQMVERVLFDTDHSVTLHGNQGHLLREHHRVFFKRAIISDVFRSNWIDQKCHLNSLAYAVAMPAAACQDVDLLSGFLLQAFDAYSSQSRTWNHPDKSRRTRKPYQRANSLFAALRCFVSQRRLPCHARCAAFKTVLDALQWQPKHIVTSVRDELANLAARAWAQAPELFKDVLSQFLAFMRPMLPNHVFIQLHEEVPSNRRWELLKLIYASNPSNPIDLEQDAHLQKLSAFDAYPHRWSRGIFEALPSQQALDLLARLANYLPRHAIVSMGGSRGSSILDAVIQDQYHDYDMMRFELDENTDPVERIERATAAVQDCKSKATHSPSSADRERLARRALSWATCSRSLQLYKSTVIWLRRFVRDVAVIRSLFSEHNICTKEAVSLLSGIPLPINSALTTEIVCSRIVEANNAIWEGFENVCAAVLEPSFRARDFISSMSLIRAVVIERMRRIERLQTHLGLSVEQISAIVWDDTVKLLIRVEATCIDPAYRRLALCSIAGPLAKDVADDVLSSRCVRIRSMAELSFVEKLHAARDALWESHRTALEPSVAKLPPGLPRGLPLHVAAGIWNLSCILPQATDSALLKRANSIVFAEPRIVMQTLPSDGKILEAIGECHEDWPFALLLLVIARKSGPERVELMRKAWLHATQNLTDTALTRVEAEGLWRSEVFNPVTLGEYYADFAAFAAQTGKQTEEPLQPPCTSGSSPHIRDTQFLARSCTKRFIFLPPTILDTMIGQNVTQKLPKRSLCFPATAFRQQSWKECDWRARWTRISESIQTHSPSTVAQPSPRQQSRSALEARIASDLLRLDKQCPGDDAIQLPFPSQSKQRFPSLVLSEELSSAPEAQYELDHGTRKRLKAAPPTLLKRLAEKVYAAREGGRWPKTSHLHVDLVFCLRASDRPVEAVPLILRIVLESPKESSWHRILFSRGLLEKLCAHDACDAVKTLAERILTRTGSPEQDTDPGSSGEGVKVSVVKLLAQMMGETSYISRPDAVDILMELLRRSTHADVRHAALDALLRMVCMGSSPSDPYSAQMIKKLGCLVPILGALDERCPEESVLPWPPGVLPSIYDSSASEGTCLFAMRRVSRSCQLVIEALEKHREKAQLLISAVIIPVVEHSIELNKRWLNRYLERHGTSTEELQLPVPPAKIDLLKNLVTRHAHLTPNWIVQLYCRYLQTVLRLPAKVQEINGRLERTRDNAGKHWLSLYESVDRWQIGSLPFLASLVYGLVDVAADEDDIVQALSSRTASVDAAAQVLLDAADLVSDPEQGAPDSFRQVLSPLAWPLSERGKRQRAKRLAWEEYLRPVLEQILDRIEAVRTPKWQRDSNRQPRWLPDTFEYRMWLLPILSVDADLTEGEAATRCREFGRMLIEQMEYLVSRGVPYHDEMKRLEMAAMSCSDQHKALLATTLGGCEGESTSDRQTQVMVRCHRLDVAATLIFNAELPAKWEAWLEELRTMVQGWHQSEVEWIRNRLHKLVTKPDETRYAFRDDTISSVVHDVTETEQQYGLFD